MTKLRFDDGLAFSKEEIVRWRYWGYGYTGNDGIDWRIDYTYGGLEDVPDYAEEMWPMKREDIPWGIYYDVKILSNEKLPLSEEEMEKWLYWKYTGTSDRGNPIVRYTDRGALGVPSWAETAQPIFKDDIVEEDCW